MPNPTCALSCDVPLPVVSFDNCAPKVFFSEIRRFFISKLSASDFADVSQATEWLARLSETNTTGDDYIRAITIIGDKPAATPIVKEISNGRKLSIGMDHTVNFTVDDLSDENYEFMRQLQCSGLFKFWFETEGAKMFGGNSGFIARISPQSVLPRGRDEIETVTGTITWRSKFDLERTDSPIYDGSTTGSTALAVTAPTGGTLNEGASKTFGPVTPSGGTAPYTFQWKKNGTNISGATASSLVKSSLVLADAGSYTVTVTDAAANTVTSAAAVLVVNALTFDTSIAIPSGTVNSAQGVSLTVGAADPQILFEFNAVNPHVGTPLNMDVYVGGTNVAVVVFPSEYAGHTFRFTDAAGVVHYDPAKVFVDGTVNF